MFRPLLIYIGLRYTRAKKRNHFISFIALASMLGIALGVTVLITVLSVMNGFDHEIHNRIFGMARQVTVTGYSGNVFGWREVQQEIAQDKDVVASAPFVMGQGMLAKDGEATGAMITGILPLEEERVSEMHNSVVQGSMFELNSGGFDIVLGSGIARKLNDRLQIKLEKRWTKIKAQYFDEIALDDKLEAYILLQVL